MNASDSRHISERDFEGVWGARAKSDGEFFTYGEVVNLPIKQVWTVYEDGGVGEDGRTDSNWYAMPGMTPGFALGYVVTDMVWGEETPDAIWYLDDDECAREDRRLQLMES